MAPGARPTLRLNAGGTAYFAASGCHPLPDEQEFRGGRVRGNPRRRGGGRLMAVARQPAGKRADYQRRGGVFSRLTFSPFRRPQPGRGKP